MRRKIAVFALMLVSFLFSSVSFEAAFAQSNRSRSSNLRSPLQHAQSQRARGKAQLAKTRLAKTALKQPDEMPPPSSAAAAGDWRGVGQNGPIELVRAHWISLTADGRLIGQISATSADGANIVPAVPMRVTFVQWGRIVSDLETDSNGRFETEDVPPGVYSVIASGPGGFLAFSVIVLPAATTNGNEAAPALEDAQTKNPSDPIRLVRRQPVESEFSIQSLAIGPPHEVLWSILNQYHPQIGGAFVGESDFSDENRNVDGALQAGVRALQDDLPQNAVPASTIRRQTVTPDENGKIVGRVLGIQRITGRPIVARGVNVFVLRNDRIAIRASTDDNGAFNLVGLQPGIYGLVVAGQEGFGAIGFEVADTNTAKKSGNAKQTFVSHVQENVPPGGNDLSIGMITDPRDLVAVLGGQGSGAGGGGSDGYSGAGGGGGGAGGAGGGDANGLGLAFGLAALAAALADDDGDGVDLPPETK